jgi:SAM-dependent methyltransferase
MAPDLHAETHAAARAFDAAAPEYDGTWESLPGTARLRRVVHALLDRVFPAGCSVLELNAGTGTDALRLAERGVRVLATDAAPRMVERIREKAAARHVDLRTQVLLLEDSGPLNGEVFDGVFSNMGGLNCVQHLGPTARALGAHLRPGGALVLGFMPSFSLWETAAFLLRGKPEEAFRRGVRTGVTVRVGGHPVTTWYHPPREVIRAFAPGFDIQEIIGLNVVSPPPGSTRMARHTGLTRVLDAADDLLGRVPPFNRAGDHMLMLFRARENRTGAGAA